MPTQALTCAKQVKTASELRLVLDTTSYLPKDESYDREKHYDRYWVQLVMAMLYVSRPLFLLGENLRQIQGFHYSRILIRCFLKLIMRPGTISTFGLWLLIDVCRISKEW